MQKSNSTIVAPEFTSWAVRVFQSWREQRNKHVTEQCPEKLLEEPTVELLNYWLSHFVTEVRREDIKPYPPACFYQQYFG